jgi:hypothetical protein
MQVGQPSPVLHFPGTGSRSEAGRATLSSTAFFLGQAAGQIQLNTFQYCLVPGTGNTSETGQATLSSSELFLGQVAGQETARATLSSRMTYQRQLKQHSPVLPFSWDRQHVRASSATLSSFCFFGTGSRSETGQATLSSMQFTIVL